MSKKVVTVEVSFCVPEALSLDEVDEKINQAINENGCDGALRLMGDWEDEDIENAGIENIGNAKEPVAD